MLFLFKTYHISGNHFFQIMDWLSKQAEINKDIMEVHTIGKTYEKRELKVVKVCNFPGKISLRYRNPLHVT